MNQAHFDTSEICRLHGVRHAVFSPGSRNAALSVSFARNEQIETRVIVDERSAGFIGLGLAQQTNTPVVLCCTSGTALLNYGPAIAEAFYQEIPLIILSADRPGEWIDQWDGQTIRQQHAFDLYTKAFYQLPTNPTSDVEIGDYYQKLSSAILLANSGKKGPVHVNIPFREPFYPESENSLSWTENLPVTKRVEARFGVDNKLLDSWNHHSRKLIVLGQGWPSDASIGLLQSISKDQNIPVINDVISNGHPIENAILYQDLFLQKTSIHGTLNPDFILTLGKSVISKNLKLFLRKSGAKEVRISPQGHLENPFQMLETVIQADPETTLGQLTGASAQPEEFMTHWQKENKSVLKHQEQLDSYPYCEFVAFKEVMNHLPTSCDLHLANSMPVRYANFLQKLPVDVRVYANRGTSGIDGTNGTAVGHALATNRKVVVLSGDLSFLYDRNAFFHSYDLSNLVFIVFNNFGGGIFDLIPGPQQLKVEEREKHFITPHGKDLKYTAIDAGFSYTKANDLVTLELALAGIFASGSKPRILEIQTDPKINQQAYLEFKQQIHE